MENNISLTIRIPEELNKCFTELSQNLGIPKVAMLRYAVWIMNENPTELSFDQMAATDNTFRFAFNVNPKTYQIIENLSLQYSQSINSIVTALIILTLERYSKYL